jgi:hypothetical protein
MSTELARCPECGANVSGQNHTAVEGVTRAMNMENWGTVKLNLSVGN